MEAITRLWKIVKNVSEPLMFFMLLNKRLERKHKITVFIPIAIIVMTCVSTYISSNNIPYIPTLLIYFYEYVLFSLLIFNGKLLYKLLWSTAMLLIMIISNSLSNIGYITIANSVGGTVLSGMEFISTASYMLLNTILVGMLMFFNEDKRILPLFVRLSIVALCIIGTISLYILMGFLIEYYDRELSATFCSIIIASIALFIIAVLLLLDGISRSIKQTNIAEARLSQTELEAQHFKQLNATYAELRKWRHDNKNHLQTLRQLAETGNLQAVTEYISQIDDYLVNTSSLVDTGNPALDAVLSNKITIINNSAIKLDYALAITEIQGLTSMEMCTIMSSLLDNAIDASNALIARKQTPWIKFKLEFRSKMLCIEVENASVGEYEFDSNEHLLTTKGNRKHHTHGICLANVTEIIEKHDGQIVIQPKEQEFSVHILLPIQ